MRQKIFAALQAFFDATGSLSGDSYAVMEDREAIDLNELADSISAALGQPPRAGGSGEPYGT